MLFNSFSYAVFLPIVFIIYWIVPKRFQWAVLLVSSYYFYMSWNIKYVFLILLITIISYTAGLLIEKTTVHRKKVFYLSLATIASLGILFLYKYYNFIAESVAAARFFSIKMNPVLLHLILPVGISFYTFQTLSYVIDIYQGQATAERHFGKYATFISFFPQLVAGPIERTSNLMPQITASHTFSYEQATYGLKLMAWGFFKKLVIADTFAGYVDTIYNNVTVYKGFAFILATFFFTIQIYCDFSGYSDIAIGTAKLFGVELMTNFRSPYFSRSVKEFWRRWHISLSTWFKDYVYIPLGGNRVSRGRHYCNLLITFIASGLWHGANWTFLVWGGIHGFAQIIEGIWHGRRKNAKQKSFVSAILTFLFVSFAWIFFRASTLGNAWYIITNSFAGITSPLIYFSEGCQAIGLGKKDLLFCMVVIAILAVYDFAAQKTDVIARIGEKKTIVRWSIYILLIWGIIFFTPVSSGKEFIYFQF